MSTPTEIDDAVYLPPMPLQNGGTSRLIASGRNLDGVPMHDLPLHVAVKRTCREHRPGEISEGVPA